MDQIESLPERIDADLKSAMRAKDETAKLTLRAVKAALTQESKQGDASHELSDDDALAVVQREAKRRRDAAAEYEKVGQRERAQQELAELAVLERYLPQQLSDEELRVIVQEGMDTVGATSMADMGKIMGAVLPRVQGRADGKRVNSMVRSILAG